jgi:hypothetical protein
MDRINNNPQNSQKSKISLEQLQKTLSDLYSQELDDKLTNAIILSEDDFLNSVRKRIKKDLDYNFNLAPELLTELNNIIKKKESEVTQWYKTVNKIVKGSLNNTFSKQKEIFLTEFKKHCNMSGDYAIHHCEGKMLPIYENNVIKYVICESCKKLYKPNSMLLYCYFCSCDYSSSILSYQMTENILPATWVNLHCGVFVNDKMRCIKCKDVFYLNVNENLLYCKSCKFSIDPMGIIWQCIYCKQDYKSPAKVYNHVEHKIIKNFIKETLSIKHKAKPLTVPCCDIRVYDHIFFHKKTCEGELFQGELNKETIILCEKCKMIFPQDKFTWTCPKCLKRFRKTMKRKDLSPPIYKNKLKAQERVSIDMTSKMNEEKLIQYKRKSSNNVISNSRSNLEENKKTESGKKIIINNIVVNNYCKGSKKIEFKKATNNLNIQVIHLNTCQNESEEIEPDCLLEKKYSFSTEEAKKQDVKIKENIKILQSLITFKIENYKILQTIGEGSYGIIYLVEENETEVKYAMKKILINNENQLITFTNEYEIVHEIKHSNVLRIKGLSHKKLDETTNVLYILMELAKTDWDKEIKHRASIKNYYTEEELVYIIRQLVNALNFLQENNIAHRDIKPQNILIFENKLFKVADFGEAKEVKLITQKHKGTLRGTELYMAPVLFNSLEHNQLIEHNPYKSDVFSLGYCVLFAATLSFNILYELRKVNNKKMTFSIISKYLSERYSAKFIVLMCRMVENNEKYRFDFIDLKGFIDKTMSTG